MPGIPRMDPTTFELVSNVYSSVQTNCSKSFTAAHSSLAGCMENASFVCSRTSSKLFACAPAIIESLSQLVLQAEWFAAAKLEHF